MFKFFSNIILLTATLTLSQIALCASKVILIEAYGDSTTEGWQVINGKSIISHNNATKVLERSLQKKYGAGVRIDNHGVGWTQASQLLYGVDGRHSVWSEQMKNSKANIVTLNFSLNDSYFQSVPTPGVISETPQAYAEMLKQLITIARNNGKQVVLYEPNPVCKEPRQSKLQYYVAHMNIVANELAVPIVAEYHTLLNIPNWQSMLSDCVHPLDSMYSLKAGYEFPVVSGIIDRMP